MNVESSTVPYQITLPTRFSYHPLPVKHLKARALNKREVKLSWCANSQKCVKSYWLYTDATLTNRIAIVQAKHGKRRYSYTVKKPSTAVFYVISVDSQGNRSPPSVAAIRE